MTIYEQIKDLLKDNIGRFVSTSEIKDALKLKYGTNASSIIPSDYCYNRINGGIKFNKHIFQWLDHNTYRYLGEKYPFTGLIFHKPANQNIELIIGEWINGRKIIYKTPVEKVSKEGAVIIDSVLGFTSTMNDIKPEDTNPIKSEEIDNSIPPLHSISQINGLIRRADDYNETKRLIEKFSAIKKIRVPFYLNLNELDEILHWKLRRQYYRQLKNIKRNTDALVRTITQSAFSIENADERLEIELKLKTIIKLHGVQIPVASAILTLCYPDKYCVIDFRGWRQIHGKVKEYQNYRAKEYIQYWSIIKRMAEKFGVTTQEIDMAIWQKDIEQNRKL